MTSITIPEGVTEIGHNAFSDCSGLTSVIISKSVTEIGNDAFNGCNSLENITILSSVTNIGPDLAFLGTKWLEEKQKENPLLIVNHIIIAGYKCYGDLEVLEGVTQISGGAFYGCIGLTSIIIP